MDIKCPICREPFDMDELHDATDLATGLPLSFDEASRRFRREGCGLLFNGTPCGTTRDPLLGAVYDLMGDDLDGAAAEIEDFDL